MPSNIYTRKNVTDVAVYFKDQLCIVEQHNRGQAACTRALVSLATWCRSSWLVNVGWWHERSISWGELSLAPADPGAVRVITSVTHVPAVCLGWCHKMSCLYLLYLETARWHVWEIIQTLQRDSNTLSAPCSCLLKVKGAKMYGMYYPHIL